MCELKAYLTFLTGQPSNEMCVYESYGEDTSMSLLSSESVAGKHVFVSFQKPAICMDTFVFHGELSDIGLPKCGVCTVHLNAQRSFEIGVRRFKENTPASHMVEVLPEQVTRICWLVDSTVVKEFVPDQVVSYDWYCILKVIRIQNLKTMDHRLDFTYCWYPYNHPGKLIGYPHCTSVRIGEHAGFDILGKVECIRD